MPIYQTEVDDDDTEITTYGADGRLLHIINDFFAVGAHANAINYDVDNAVDDSFHTYAGGPFASLRFPLADLAVFSGGVLLNYVDPEDDEDTWFGAIGGNLGFQVTDRVAVNPYGIYYHDFDPEDKMDDDFGEVGCEVWTTVTDNVQLKVGVKFVVDYEDYQATEGNVLLLVDF